jgi:branched-chain amino acid aminotransferase
LTEIANVSGRISPAGEARIPVLDRSFLFGDGVYESLRTHRGRPLFLQRHLQRLEASAGLLQITLPVDRMALTREVERTLEATATPESLLRIIVSRGQGWLPRDPRLCTPALLVILAAPFEPIPEEVFHKGRSAVVVQVRRNPVSSLDPAIKSNNLLNNLLASMEALDRQVPEALLLNTQGDLAEAANANVFAVLEGTLQTPALECGILAGITREVVLELARAAGMPCRETRIPGDRLAGAEELFLTSTTREVLPLVELDGKAVGDGRPGPWARRLLRIYREHMDAAV